jgi:hypothetical protein
MPRSRAWLVILTCAAPRLLALLVFRDRPVTLYLTLAENLTDRHSYSLDAGTTSLIEPFYPLVLAAARAVSGGMQWPMLVLQVAVASLAGLALFALARGRSGSDRVAWIATLLYACSPYLVRQAASFMEVTIGTALAIFTVWAVDRTRGPREAALAGLVLAALVLTRFSFLPIAAGAIALVAMRRVASGAVTALATVTALAPWLVFSHATSGTLLPPRIGENLFVSTSEWAESIVPRVNVDVLLPLTEALVEQELGPSYAIADRDELLLHRSLAYVRAHPRRAVALKLKNLACVLQPRLLPFTERRGSAELVGGALVIPPQAARPLPFELAAGGFQALLLAGAAAGLWKRRYHLPAEDAPLLLVACSVVAVNVIFFPTSRLLAPMTFVPMFYTAVLVGR